MRTFLSEPWIFSLIHLNSSLEIFSFISRRTCMFLSSAEAGGAMDCGWMSSFGEEPLFSCTGSLAPLCLSFSSIVGLIEKPNAVAYGWF